MSTTATITTDDPTELRAFITLAGRLLDVVAEEAPSVEAALAALIHSFVAVVRVHPHLAVAAQRILVSATRALIATDGQPPALPPSTAFH